MIVMVIVVDVVVVDIVTIIARKIVIVDKQRDRQTNQPQKQ